MKLAESRELKVERPILKRRGVIGRACLVRDHKHSDRVFFGATIIDCVAGKPDRAKRIRLQTGEHAGEVRMRGEYDLIEFTD